MAEAMPVTMIMAAIEIMDIGDEVPVHIAEVRALMVVTGEVTVDG